MKAFLLAQALGFSIAGILVSLFKDDDMAFALSFCVMTILVIVQCIDLIQQDKGNSGDLS
jgi:hypothetical protein